MKKLLYSALLAVVCAAPLLAHAADEETVTHFDVAATLDQKANLQFTESIGYDFGPAEKHGIYRTIPVRYERENGTYLLRLNVLGVQRDSADEVYTKESADGDLRLKIGRADTTITGAHDYMIRYATDRAVNFFPDHDELYWNVTGNGWEVPISEASFTLTLPEGLQASQVTSTCFVGPVGSTEGSCNIQLSGDHAIEVKATRELSPYEGLTVVLGFPKGILHEPTPMEKAWRVLADNGVLFFPLCALLVMGYMWWTRGRDPKLGTVIPEYEPPQKLTPAVTGAVMTNGSVPQRCTTATIIDLARRGFLKIRFGEEKHLLGDKQTFTFVNVKDTDGTLNAYERDIHSGLFSGGDERTVADLADGKFYESVQNFTKDVQKEVDGMKIFVANPSAVRGAYIAVTIILTWGLVFFFGDTGIGVFSGFLTGAIVLGFGMFMPRRTKEGVRLLAGVEGFKWFLSVTEKDRLAFHDAPKQTPEQFNALLAYAIVFGVEKKWAEQFASLNVPPPSWAEGAAISHWNTVNFASSLGSLHQSASASSYSAPSSAGSGGSGFSGGGSGGGFGGGGGGSW